MRVALACDWFLKYAAAQAAGLARAGAQVSLLCREHAGEFDSDQRERTAALNLARAEGVQVYETPGRLWDPAATPALVRIRRHLARFGPDVVHLHEGVDPRALALLPRAPVVLTVHDPHPHPGHPLVRDGPKRWVLERSRLAWRGRARMLIVHSAALADQVTVSPAQICAVIPHGIEVRSEPLPPPATPTVGFFGRLQPYKGLEVLAGAMPRVWATRPEVHLKVAGEGPIDLPLRDPRVDFRRAYLPESGVEAFFRAVTLTVLPYTQASQTGAGSLAIGLGVPVIASRTGGLPDLALEPSYLSEPGDQAGLARAILCHIDDGLQVRRRVLSELAGPRGWDAVASATLKLYEQMLSRR